MADTDNILRKRLSIGVVVLFSVLFVTLLFGVLYILLQLAFPAQAPRPAPAAVITLIAAPSATSLPLPTLANGPTATPTPVPPGMMGIGAYVQISGTGGDGLRLRTGPGKSNDPLFLGGESEVFLVKDGPKLADDYTWWYLAAPYDEQRRGWAVENYLVVIPSQNGVTPQP